MRTTPIGLAMLNDERPHVWQQNNEQNTKVLRAWAQVLQDGLKNHDGSTPEVVVADKIIVSVRTAQEVGEQLRRAGCRSVVMCYNVWNFPFLAWPFVNTLGAGVPRAMPILSLSNNNGQFPGNVGLLATDGALRQAGLRTHRIVGQIDDELTQRRVLDWVRAAQAVTTIRSECYGLYGGHSMGMETGYYHLTPTLKALGTTCRQIDQLWLVKVMENEVDAAEVEKGFAWLTKMLGDRIRYDGKMLTPETLKTQIRLYLAMKMVNEERGFDFCGLKGQRELTEHVCLGDLPEMIMNDPYDWNGSKEPVVCATEADAFAAVTMQLLKYVSGGLPSLFMDVRLYLPELGLWDMCNSGNHSSWYAARSFDPAENFGRIHLHPALEYYFKAGGASVEFDAAPGELTFARLGLWDEKPYLLILTAEAVELPAKQRREINEGTNPTWPHVHARLHCDDQEFIATFPCNHAQAVAGDVSRSLIDLCEMTGITPVVLGEAGEGRMPPIWERVR
ncbi:MAG TPA: fucose isomerase [Phycisphaerae bacterium]|nr:fucose isomerase [Phycisphaerae bacterium]